MNYIKLSTLEFPLYEGDVRIDHPEIGKDFVCPDTYATVNINEKPSYNIATQKTVFGAPFEKDGEWFVDVLVVELTEEEKQFITKNPFEPTEDPIKVEVLL